MDVFVCDLGFSSAKWMFGNKRGRIPSAFKRQNGEVILGEEALVRVGASYLKTPEELIRMYPAFVQKCMEAAGVEQDVRVAVGLPYTFWEQQRKIPGGAIDALTTSLGQLANVGGVMVCPQGLGGIRMFLDEHQDVSGSVLGVDIGFNTAIWCLFNADTGKLVYGDTMNKRGVYQLATDHLLPNISHLVPARTLTPIEISMLMEQGSIQYGVDHNDITQETAAAAEEYMENILDDIVGEIQAHAGVTAQFNHLLLFGGGAHYVGEGLKQRMDSVVILDDPEYANASGFAALTEDAA